MVPDASISGPRAAAAVFFLTWYAVILGVAYNGFFELLRKFRSPPKNRLSDDLLEGVTILRPIKGIDPELATCLESLFLQNYPALKLQILFCVDNPNDPLVGTIQALIARHPQVDARILVSEGFNSETSQSDDHYGPNPKVNNLAKGYWHAKHDILWIMDLNVWASPNILQNSVKALLENTNNGRQVLASRPVKLVHHVPLALSVSPQVSAPSDSEYVLGEGSGTHRRFLKKLGARLDEMFLLTSHSKFYVSLNNVAIAPCVNGKSNLYRRSDLDKAVASIPEMDLAFFNTRLVVSDARHFASSGPGNALKFFARYIGEDNMIAIALWEALHSRTGLTGDVVIQPLSGTDNSVRDYVNRRARWLRVRKYMVLMATLVEPTTESLVSGIFGTFSISTLLWGRWFSWRLFLVHLAIWMATDYVQFYTLVNSMAGAKYTPEWLHHKSLPPLQRSFADWAYVWALRELLALPIWIWAMVGHEIDWRGKPFKIKQDLTAEEM